MKVKWSYLKKPSVIIGAVVLFFILLFMLNKGGSASKSTQVVNTGPSDAQVAAQTQMGMAQLSAGLQGQALQVDYAKAQDSNATQIALATMAAALQGQSLAVQRDIAAQTVAAQVHGLDLNYQTSLANNDFALKYAQEQYDYGITSQAINANTTLQLSAQQLQAFKLSTDAMLVTSLVGHNHYSSIALPAFFSAQNGSGTANYSQVGTVS